MCADLRPNLRRADAMWRYSYVRTANYLRWSDGVRRHPHLRPHLHSANHMRWSDGMRRNPHLRTDLCANLWRSNAMPGHPHLCAHLCAHVWRADALWRHSHLCTGCNMRCADAVQHSDLC